MRSRLLAAASAATMMIGLGVSGAQADRLADPGLCPGILTVAGGYRLAHNVTCDFTWATSNQTLDLNQHTLTGFFLPTGTKQTVKNGSVRATAQEYWAGATTFTMSKVKISPATPTAITGFMIEAGDGLTVTHSTITGAPIGLGFYFGSAGKVNKTVFKGNLDGLTIQKGSSVVVQNSTFTGNQTGLLLRNEDSYGVNTNTIKGNTFRNNSAFGLAFTLNAFSSAVTGTGNVIDKNTFTGSGGSGIYISLTCEGLVSSVQCPGAGSKITHNTLTKNGFTAPVGTPFIDDGITARATQFTYAGSTVAYPAGLSGFAVGKNTAARNKDLGIDVPGVTDASGNRAGLNGNPAQCAGVVCLDLTSLTSAGATDAVDNAKIAAEATPLLRQSGSVPFFVHH